MVVAVNIWENFPSSLCARAVLDIERSIAENFPFEGFILVGWPVISSTRLSCVRSSSIILPLVSVLYDPQLML